jgi:hypothetical protein
VNRDPLLANLLLHSYDADFLQMLFKNKDRNFVDIYLHLIYSNELKVVKDTTDTQKLRLTLTFTLKSTTKED